MNKLLLTFVFLFCLSAPVFAQLVGTDIKPGDACTAAQEGHIARNASADRDTSEITLICDGTQWQSATGGGGSGGGGNLPTCADGDTITYSSGSWSCFTKNADPFAFGDNTNVALSNLTTSNIVQMTGILTLLQTSITGDGGPQYRICSDSDCSSVLVNWTSSPNTIQNDRYIQLRLTSSASNSTPLTSTIEVGSQEVDWTVTTIPACTGILVGGYCWYASANSESCDTACASRGGCNLAGTKDYAGSGAGTAVNCEGVLDALALGTGTANFGYSNESGCYYNAGATNPKRRVGGQTTTCADSNSAYRRACACNW